MFRPSSLFAGADIIITDSVSFPSVMPKSFSTACKDSCLVDQVDSYSSRDMNKKAPISISPP